MNAQKLSIVTGEAVTIGEINKLVRLNKQVSFPCKLTLACDDGEFKLSNP